MPTGAAPTAPADSVAPGCCGAGVVGVPAMRPTASEGPVVKATWGTVTCVLSVEVVVQVCAPAGAWICPSAIWLTGAPVDPAGQGTVTVTSVSMGITV